MNSWMGVACHLYNTVQYSTAEIHPAPGASEPSLVQPLGQLLLLLRLVHGRSWGVAVPRPWLVHPPVTWPEGRLWLVQLVGAGVAVPPPGGRGAQPAARAQRGDVGADTAAQVRRPYCRAVNEPSRSSHQFPEKTPTNTFTVKNLLTHACPQRSKLMGGCKDLAS